MKRIDTTNKSKEELIASLAEFRAQLVQLEFDRADKKLKDVSQFKKPKKILLGSQQPYTPYNMITTIATPNP